MGPVLQGTSRGTFLLVTRSTWDKPVMKTNQSHPQIFLGDWRFWVNSDPTCGTSPPVHSGQPQAVLGCASIRFCPAVIGTPLLPPPAQLAVARPQQASWDEEFLTGSAGSVPLPSRDTCLESARGCQSQTLWNHTPDCAGGHTGSRWGWAWVGKNDFSSLLWAPGNIQVWLVGSSLRGRCASHSPDPTLAPSQRPEETMEGGAEHGQQKGIFSPCRPQSYLSSSSSSPICKHLVFYFTDRTVEAQGREGGG